MMSKPVSGITFLNEPEPILFHTVKWFHLFISNRNNCFWYWLFISAQFYVFKNCYVSLTINYQVFFTQLKVKTALFSTIQFSISTQFRYQTVLFDQQIGPYQMLQLRAKIDLGAMAMKRLFRISESLAIRLFSIISRICGHPFQNKTCSLFLNFDILVGLRYLTNINDLPMISKQVKKTGERVVEKVMIGKQSISLVFRIIEN